MTAAPAFPYDYVLFDWDGCIANSITIWLSATRSTCTDFGLNPTDEQIAGSMGGWQTVRKLGVTDEQYETFIATMINHANQHLADVEFYDDAAWLIKGLRAEGIKTAIVTTAMRSNLSTPYIRLGGDSLFDAVIAGDDVTNHKPHAEPVEKALQALGYTNGRAIMLGDTENDLLAGRAAGIDTMLMHHPGNELHRSLEFLLAHEPTHVCTSFKDASTILLP